MRTGVPVRPWDEFGADVAAGLDKVVIDDRVTVVESATMAVPSSENTWPDTVIAVLLCSSIPSTE